jgi:hypothetical protein
MHCLCNNVSIGSAQQSDILATIRSRRLGPVRGVFRRSLDCSSIHPVLAKKASEEISELD